MDLERLATRIETLQERIARHGDLLRKSETWTRMALIDPLLQALGWDTTDPAVVVPEHNINGQRADYALIGAAGKPVAVIEAKKLGATHVDHLLQMINYANVDGIPYAVLTDGDQWQMYDVFRRGKLDDRRILDVRIVEGKSHKLVLDLLLLWRVNLATGSPGEAGKPISSSETGFASQPPPITESAAPPELEPPDAERAKGQDRLSLSPLQAADHKSAPGQGAEGVSARIERRGRPSRWAGHIIKCLKKENPRGKGTLGWKAYQFLLDNGGEVSYEKYKEAGHESKHLTWDLDKGNLSITKPQ